MFHENSNATRKSIEVDLYAFCVLIQLGKEIRTECLRPFNNCSFNFFANKEYARSVCRNKSVYNPIIVAFKQVKRMLHVFFSYAGKNILVLDFIDVRQLIEICICKPFRMNFGADKSKWRHGEIGAGRCLRTSTIRDKFLYVNERVIFFFASDE